MYIDFHTHGKLAKYLPFSTEYTDWLLGEAKRSGLDAICLTEHFNTAQFDELYGYIASKGEQVGDAFAFGGLKVFPGMETDIAEGGHVICVGKMDAVRELNRRLEPHKEKGKFLPAGELFDLFDEYHLLVGAGHPFRDGGHIPELDEGMLKRFDFIDLNGKDLARDRERAGSDTHQAVQYGCVRTLFERPFDTVEDMEKEIKAGNYRIVINPEAGFKVKPADLLKRSLKEIHALGGDYVSVLLRKSGESPAVLAAKGAN